MWLATLKNIQITELEAAQIPRSIEDLDAAVSMLTMHYQPVLILQKMAYS